jgi:uncharacterized integral membrane protein (TIGR00698 family)
MKFDTKLIFFLALIVVASGLVSPPLALLAGIVFAFVFVHPYTAESKQLSRFLLQASVVALGFGMDLKEVIQAGRAGVFYTAISISAALLLGWALGRALRVPKKAAFLITIGTAICGGSAIAAIAPITHPDDDEMAMSLGTIFVLNSIALLLFPAIGFALHLSQSQFGLWAALAIHDTSSVVGAASRYGAQALAFGTTVKLTRALWIVPVAMLTAAITQRASRDQAQARTRLQWPWFILFFCLAAVTKTYLPAPALYPALSRLGRLGLAVVLFLIGTGLSRETLRRTGVRPMLQGVVLWIIVASVSLWAIHAGWIAL